MSATDPKHIDAVARKIDPGAHSEHALVTRQWEDFRARAREQARWVLDSSDPAVHAAMLDALTRHGVLTEETRDHCRYCGQVQGLMHPRECDFSRGRSPYSSVQRRRHVTSWEVQP